MQILNPKDCNPNDIKKTIIQENSDLKIITEYPNGFKITLDLNSDCTFNITTSGKLVNLGNDIYQVPN